MTASREVELEGHIIDSGMMERAFSLIMDMGASFEVEAFDIGRHETARSYARLLVEASDKDHLQSIIHELHQNGANPADPRDATFDPAPADRVVPMDFYSTTNHPTDIRIDGEWLPVERIEMDCAVVVAGVDQASTEPSSDADAEPNSRDGPDGPRASTRVLNAIEAGDLVVTGQTGIRVRPPERPRSQEGAFGFMQGGVSSERPSELTIGEIADAIEETKAAGGDVSRSPAPR